MLRRIGRVIFKLLPLWSWRVCFYGSVVAVTLVGGVILGLRYWLLPNVEAYRGDLEAVLTKATGQRVTIGRITGDWQGWRPQLALGDVTVYDKAGQAALTLGRIDQTLSWLSLVFFEPRFYSLEIQQPELEVKRAADGSFSVAGIELRKTAEGGGLADWLLRQRELVVRRATITWVDEKLAAPALRLDHVTLRLSNDFHRHRFGLRASAPEHLAGPLDVRGDFHGGSVRRTREWEGRLFVQLDYADLAAWRQWLEMPVDIAQGSGALRMWMDVADDRVTGIVADVRLANVKARLAPELDLLDLSALSGRVGWRNWKQGFAVFAQQLSAVAENGRVHPAADFNLKRIFARGDKPASGELKANALELEPLMEIAEHLPIDPELRAAFARYSPRGSINALGVKWSGDWPFAKYEVKGAFARFGLNPVEYFPGVSNLSGSIEANEKRGTLTLANKGTRLELTRVFAEELQFDELAGQVSWTRNADEYDIRLTGLSFANADLAGTLQGTYQTVANGRGIVDLSGALSRADVHQVPRYLPLVVKKATREWLAVALVAGHSNDVRLRLKGDLADFPFDRGQKGVFEVKAHAQNGVLDYASGWPRIENIVADVAFVANRMEIRAQSGSIFGAQLARVTAAIADLSHAAEILEVSGEAEGPTADFLRFIAESPVAEMIDRFTEGMEAQGRGRLGLKLSLPLRAHKDSRVAGNFQFVNNRLRVDPDIPALEQVNGRLDFTENAVQGSNIGAQIFGGTGIINIATQGGAVVVTATGRANVDQMRGNAEGLARAFSGIADWKGSVTVRSKLADIVVESNLQGVTSTLPAPLGKTAEEAVALRFERQSKGRSEDQIEVRWGDIVQLSAQRRREGAQLHVERVALGLGTEPPAAETSGIWVRGSLPAIDLDRWQILLRKTGTADAVVVPALAHLDVKIGRLDVLGRRLNDVALLGKRHAEGWQSKVSATELSGEIQWQPQGKGQVIARLARMSLPNAPERADIAAAPAETYPALDIVVEDFNHRSRSLGRLELVAVPQGPDWHIDRLQVKNADATFTADGYWQWQARVPRTQLSVRLDVVDVGKLLARLGLPEGIRSTHARINGALSWAGTPHEMDFPTLAGHLVLEVGRGQFLRLDPGIGKLLSILSLQALPRRVALDFKDVFSEGFVFDEILGSIKLQRGVGSTEGFRINGSSAKISMSGEVDFAHETQKLRVRVTPSLGDSVATVTALLGGPVAGLGVFLAQKLLNDPFGQMIAYDYSVTGSWQEPQVTKLTIERQPPEPG